MLTHTYLIATFYLLFVWLIVFIFNPNKTKMLICSVAGMILGPFVQLMHLSDWWHPHFLYPGFVHLEDLIFGFAVLGITCTIFEVVFPKQQLAVKSKKDRTYFIFIVLIGLIVSFVPFFVWHIHSFITTSVTSLFLIMAIVYKNKYLWKKLLISGVLVVIITFPFYCVGLRLYPHWIADEWSLSNLTGVLIFGVPIEDLLWFFMIGLSFPGMWDLLVDGQQSPHSTK